MAETNTIRETLSTESVKQFNCPNFTLNNLQNNDLLLYNASLTSFVNQPEITTVVTSFNGRQGPVVPLSGDYNYEQITGMPATLVSSFNGRSGAIAPSYADYNFTEITGTLLPPQIDPYGATTGNVMGYNGSKWLPTSPSVTPSQITQGGATTGQLLEWNGTNWVPYTLTPSVSPSEITQGGATTGQLLEWNGTNWVPYTFSLGSQTENTVYAAPNGSAGNPTFRSLLAADLPTFSSNELFYGGSSGALTQSPTLTYNSTTDKISCTNIVATGNCTVDTIFSLNGSFVDNSSSSGSTKQYLSSTGTNVVWSQPSLANLVDCNISSPSIGQIILWNGSAWQNFTPTVAPSEITQGGASTGELLQWNGTNWIPYALTSTAFGSQIANTVLAAPNGSSGNPTFRALTTADFPTFTGNQFLYANSSGVMQATGNLYFKTGRNIIVASGAITADSYFSNGATQYSTGTVSQSGYTITGSGTTFTSAMVGAYIFFGNSMGALITAFTSTTQLTASVSQTISSQVYVIYYGGFQVDIYGNTGLNNTVYMTGALMDSVNSSGSSGQLLTSTGSVIKWANPSVTPSQITQGSATTGQLLEWNGTNWVPYTLAITPSEFGSQTANTVLAAPDGSSGNPTFRALSIDDLPIPTLASGNWNPSLTTSNLVSTPVTTAGHYSQNGNIVTCSLYLTMESSAASTEYSLTCSLPVIPSANWTNNTFLTGSFSTTNGSTTSYLPCSTLLQNTNGGTTMNIYIVFSSTFPNSTLMAIQGCFQYTITGGGH